MRPFVKTTSATYREEYLGRIKSTRALLERKKATVTTGKQQLATVAAAVTASGANNEERRAQITTIMAQLEKTEADVAIADDMLEVLRTKKEAKVARRTIQKMLTGFEILNQRQITMQQRRLLSKRRYFGNSTESLRRNRRYTQMHHLTRGKIMPQL